MQELTLDIPPHRRAAARFNGTCRRALLVAFGDSGKTISEVAQGVEMDETDLVALFNGKSNMTTYQFAVIGHYLGLVIKLDITNTNEGK